MDIASKVREHLTPSEGKAHRAHLFTINGYTYPFVRTFSFACVPDPPETNAGMSRRRYSMLAGLLGTRPGDLLFFFQGDPQYPKDDIENRRGFRGIYEIVSPPFRDLTTIKHPDTGYEIHGTCPNCSSPFATLGESCKVCDEPYPEVPVKAVYRNKPPDGVSPFRIHNLSARLLVKPWVVFARALGDNRAYMSMDDAMIWISRSDNAMGAGKGSSIRILLPEEAVKITHLLETEINQEIIQLNPLPYPSNTNGVITNEDSVPSIYPRLHDTQTLQHELHLNLHLARTLDEPNSFIRQALGDVIKASHMEYWGSEFPWGYTGDTADFVCTLHNGKQRYRIVIFEFKRNEIDDYALVQVMLYVNWVAQICTQFAKPDINYCEVVPVVVGNQNRLHAKPDDYSFKVKYMIGSEKTIHVFSPMILEYSPVGIFRKDRTLYAKDIKYHNISAKIAKMSWQAPPGISTSSVEREWVVASSWAPTVKSAFQKTPGQ